MSNELTIIQIVSLAGAGGISVGTLGYYTWNKIRVWRLRRKAMSTSSVEQIKIMGIVKRLNIFRRVGCPIAVCAAVVVLYLGQLFN